ncbi:hypothetical protein C8T65DRAFT_16765 [Cerioporus squamosus]|nr:hypothetical protein C8T65DRAFT_16765 [Cerioporus squamosus]
MIPCCMVPRPAFWMVSCELLLVGVGLRPSSRIYSFWTRMASSLDILGISNADSRGGTRRTWIDATIFLSQAHLRTRRPVKPVRKDAQ